MDPTKNTTEKTKKMSNTDPTKNPGVNPLAREVLLYSQYVVDTTMRKQLQTHRK
jgi:hypothetical protein